MTFEQIAAFSIMAAMMAGFVWGRLRYDIVAGLALAASVATGIVPAKEAFKGFSDDIVIIVGSALVISAAIARSGLVEIVLKWAAPYLNSPGRQVAALAGATTALSGFVKNIGTLAMLLPVAFQLARRTGTSPAILLMPMAFGSLLGGLMTLVGTSPNIIVSRSREEILGQPFEMFDFLPVGLGLSVAGLVFLVFGYRLLPRDRRGTASMDSAFNIEDYVTEATITAESPLVGQTIADLKALSDEPVRVTRLIRTDLAQRWPSARTRLQEGDLLLLAAEPAVLERIVARANLHLARQHKEVETSDPEDEIGVLEAVITSESPLVGRTISEMQVYTRFDVNVLAISRRGRRITERLKTVRLNAGDAIVVQGNLRFLPEALGELGCLPLAERNIGLGQARRGALPVAIMAAAILLVTLDILPIAFALFAAAGAMVLSRALTAREAYAAIDWPILVMLAALIPVSDALRTTGGTELIAGWLSSIAHMLPPIGALALVLIAAMAVTPFLNNAATVLVMAPIATVLAQRLGLNPDPLLMAVAVGAGCDFLTPVGHQCNTLVMGPGGYRFSDYWRLGLPLSLIVILLGVPLIAFFWPLAGAGPAP